jgi:hypothetical protein
MLGRSSSSSPFTIDPILELFFTSALAIRVPIVVVGNILGILRENTADSLPVVVAIAY